VPARLIAQLPIVIAASITVRMLDIQAIAYKLHRDVQSANEEYSSKEAHSTLPAHLHQGTFVDKWISMATALKTYHLASERPSEKQLRMTMHSYTDSELCHERQRFQFLAAMSTIGESFIHGNHNRSRFVLY
jgi:hypothetical protein